MKLFLVKRRVEGSTYPTLGATLVVETLFDFVVATGIFLWALHLGVLPEPRPPAEPAARSTGRWPLEHPRVLEDRGPDPSSLLAIGGLVWATTRRVREFWQPRARRASRSCATGRRATSGAS